MLMNIICLKVDSLGYILSQTVFAIYYYASRTRGGLRKLTKVAKIEGYLRSSNLTKSIGHMRLPVSGN